MLFGSEADQPRTSVSRRDFLAVGGLSMVGLSVAEQAAVRRARERSGGRSCILILLTGGPSQLETFDPKPDAPREVRGPLKAIATSLPGMRFSECLPRLAERADRLTVLRSLHHEAAPTHEAGLQLLQTGRLVAKGTRHASLGSMVSRLLGPRGTSPAHVLIPGRLTHTGVDTYRGDGSGFLGDAFEPILPQIPGDFVDGGSRIPEFTGFKSFDEQPIAVRDAYGDTRFGRLLLQARQLVERGVRVVTVNSFTRLDGHVTWDAHADRIHAPGTLFDHRDTIGPQFDRACAALLDDLRQRGLLEETLVVCAGEMGRTPRLNEHGGRDHWTNAWSAIMAGCGLPEGAVIGATDGIAAEPSDDPIELSRLLPTIYNRLRIDPSAGVHPDWPITACSPTSTVGIDLG
ncbi:MAG: DUF1501 domain-containing protein [Planctomycetaceae bacterium]